MPMENPSFRLENAIREKDTLQDFEGPLSVILMLLAKNKIEIRDISISEILDQYLAYLDEMQRMDLEIASEFIQMASHLLYIKTKMLLSGEEEVTELEVLIASLEQLKSKELYANLQQVIPAMKKASETGLLYFTKTQEPVQAPKSYEYRHDPQDLLSALSKVFSRGVRAPGEESLVNAIPQRIVYSIKDKSLHILTTLRNGPQTLRQLYAECGSRSELIAAFISVLELCSMGSVVVTRDGDDFSVEFSGGDIDEIMEQIIE